MRPWGLPVSGAGVALAFWATGIPFGREAAVGLILMLGLAVNQTILLVDAALERRGHRAPALCPLGPRAVLAAAGKRAGMIVVVTLITLASLLPLPVGTDPGSRFGSIARATAGGTIVGIVGSLWVVPALLP